MNLNDTGPPSTELLKHFETKHSPPNGSQEPTVLTGVTGVLTLTPQLPPSTSVPVERKLGQGSVCCFPGDKKINIKNL